MKKRSIKIACILLAIFIPIFIIGYTFAWYTDYEVYTLSFAGSAKGAYFEGGNGTETSPYRISNRQHLYNFAWLQNLGKFEDKQYFFELSSDVDMTGLILPPIGNDEFSFKGVFNGNGKTISNLTISTNINVLTNLPGKVTDYVFSNSVGFFGMTGTGSDVANFILKNPTVEVAANASYNGVLSDNSDPTTESSPCAVGLAIGYIMSAASSIGVVGGKLAVRKANYETINSILGKAQKDLTVDVTGGSGDTGIFNPNSDTKLADALKKNYTLAKEDGINENGLWITSAAKDSSLGAFTVTVKPKINSSQTSIGTATITVSDLKMKDVNDTSKSVAIGDNASYIVDANNEPLKTITGYLSFSGRAESYSYDRVIDEYGEDVSSTYSAGSHTAIANSIKFNISKNSAGNATLYVVAASNSSETRYLGLYKTFDTNNNDIDYSDPNLFYEEYACADGHNKYHYNWDNTQKDNPSYWTYLYNTSARLGKVCEYPIDCEGTIVYDSTSETYRCTNYNLCEKELTSTQTSSVTYTDTCAIHGGTRGSGYVVMEDNSGKQFKSVLMCAGTVTTTTTTNNNGFGGNNRPGNNNNNNQTTTTTTTSITHKSSSNVTDVTPIEYVSSGSTVATDADYKYYEVDYDDETYSTTYYPLAVTTSSPYTFKVNYDGFVTLHFKGTNNSSVSINGTTYDLNSPSTSTSSVKDYTLTLAVKGDSSNIVVKPSSGTIYLSYIKYESKTFTSSNIVTDSANVTDAKVAYYKDITYCSNAQTTEHKTTDFEIEQIADYAHTKPCQNIIRCNTEAQVVEDDPPEGQTLAEVKNDSSLTKLIATFALSSGKTPVFYAYTIKDAGSYMLASTKSGINIYYLRINGMEGGNASTSNITNVDFVYSGVTIEKNNDTENSGSEYLFTVNGKEYTATKTRIYFSSANFGSGILLYFYRDTSGEKFYVGYNPSTPAGSATFISIDDNLTIDDVYTPTDWTP